jgi:hypothetical protein
MNKKVATKSPTSTSGSGKGVPPRTQRTNLTAPRCFRKIVRFQLQSGWRATEQDPVVKEAKSDAELEDMILQRLLIGGVFVSVRRDPLLGWRPTVVTAPKHTKNAQELADKIAAELRKKFTLKQ